MPTVPPGRLPLMDTVGWIVMLKEPVASGVPAESVTCTVKFGLPAAVGFPEIVPPELSVSPDGSEPDRRLQEYGAPELPLALRGGVAVPTAPSGNDVGDRRHRRWGNRQCGADRFACVGGIAVTVTGDDPAGDGRVPQTLPVASMFRPAGRPDALQLYDPLPPAAVNGAAEYGTPATPPGNAPLTASAMLTERSCAPVAGVGDAESVTETESVQTPAVLAYR